MSSPGVTQLNLSAALGEPGMGRNTPPPMPDPMQAMHLFMEMWRTLYAGQAQSYAKQPDISLLPYWNGIIYLHGHSTFGLIGNSCNKAREGVRK